MEQGNIDEFIDADHDQHLQGTVQGDFIVRAGVTLIIDGVLNGGGSVEDGGHLMVRGVFNGKIYGNEGSVFLSGVLSQLPSSFVKGRVFVGAGSLVTVRAPYILNADGSKRQLRSGETLDQRAPSDNWLEMVPHQEFVPVPE